MIGRSELPADPLLAATIDPRMIDPDPEAVTVTHNNNLLSMLPDYGTEPVPEQQADEGT